MEGRDCSGGREISDEGIPRGNEGDREGGI